MPNKYQNKTFQTLPTKKLKWKKFKSSQTLVFSNSFCESISFVSSSILSKASANLSSDIALLISTALCLFITFLSDNIYKYKYSKTPILNLLHWTNIEISSSTTHATLNIFFQQDSYGCTVRTDLPVQRTSLLRNEAPFLFHICHGEH